VDPEAVLVIVAAALFGVVVWLVALAMGRAQHRALEHRAWWRLVFPLFSGLVMIAFLVGWAIQEPDPADERVGLALGLVAVVTGLITLRAIVRSVTALRLSSDAQVPLGTVGFVKPRVIVSEALRRIASREILAAGLAHEAAHVEHRDPLRIWVAQLAADLQWPIPGTARRFSAWLLALEAQRDDEAVASGVAPEDLAEAILIAARLQRGAPVTAANVLGAGDGIAWRVRRLLATDRSVVPVSHAAAMWISCTAVVIAAVGLGISYGDAVVGSLPGIGP